MTLQLVETRLHYAATIT